MLSAMLISVSVGCVVGIGAILVSVSKNGEVTDCTEGESINDRLTIDELMSKSYEIPVELVRNDA